MINGPGLEESEVSLFVGRDLTKGMDREMDGLLKGSERHQADLVRQAAFLERPTHASVSRQAPAPVG